jgi:alanine racemase
VAGPGADRRVPANYEPWLELDPGALLHNAREAARLAGGRPLLAVVKNHGYGLGTERVGRILEGAPEVAALAVVKPAEALALREAGVRKPVLLMARVDLETGVELARREVRLAPFTDDAVPLLRDIARTVGRPVAVHACIDTGLNRIGMPWHRALPWLQELATSRVAELEGVFTTLTEDPDFDPEQVARFRGVVEAARAAGVGTGPVHAAASNGLFFRRDALLDRVRTGLVLYGAYPAGASELGLAELRPAFRLRARVVRVERLRPGDSVGYGREHVADRDTWVATLPVGHADGYPRTAGRGARVLIAGRTCAVVGAVSASHTMVELGETPTVAPGAVATLVGPDHDAILPHRVAAAAGISVYDILMRLSPLLPVRQDVTLPPRST